MFDVPVLEVTVSLPPTIISSVSQSRSKKLNLVRPEVSLNSTAAAGRHQFDTTFNAVDEVSQATANPSAKTLLPQGHFQLLEPLNLADAAESLEKIFVLPTEESTLPDSGADSLTLPPAIRIIASDITEADVQTPSSVDDTLSVTASSIAASSVAASSVAIAKFTNPIPAPPLRKHLDHCVDIPYSAVQGTSTFQVIRQGTVIGEVSSRHGTDHVVRSLQAMLLPEQLDPNAIRPVLGDTQPVIRLSDHAFARVIHEGSDNNATPENKPTLSHEWAAINWSDQLRQQLGAAPLDAGDVQVMLKRLKSSEQQLNGTASWYGPYFHGRVTANGETFDQNTLTAAHKSLPFNTVLQVRNLKNSQSVVVRINDRGPYIGKRSLDLSKAAAQCLGSETIGVIPYEAIILEQPEG
ncbi:MAG: septal ring lytic transglycosylase RlpA family protein [Cyanobacteria bacterium P01_F01_bin.13]